MTSTVMTGTVMTSTVGRLRWYAYRLLAMQPREVSHRLREAARRRSAGLRPQGWARFADAAGPLPALPVDIEALRSAAGDLATVWRDLAPADGSAGRYRALGHEFRLSRHVDWHRDPATGLSWPSDAYCFDIPYRHDRERGDIKLVWELNRLQFVPVIAALAVLERDDAAAQAALDLVEGWIDANPPFRGVNWISGIELALRVVSILLTVGLLGEARVGGRLSSKIGACLKAHAVWLARYPSRFSSANNHLVAEVAALSILGTLWPGHGIDEAAARSTLLEEVARQVLPDGVGAEQSPTYAAFTCEWILLAARVAAGAGRPFPPAALERIGRAGEHLRWLMDESGRMPRIGDDDEGRVMSAGAGHEPLYAASILGGIAALTGRRDLAAPSAARRWRNALLGFEAADAAAPTGTRLFAQGGYTVVRRRIAGRSALVAMDHGPLGYLAIAAHGHADALSIWLHLDGSPVFVDAGTYLYHAGGEARDRLRGTAAHNTASVDGADQSRITGAFNWGRKARAELVEMALADRDATRVTARHDGYEHAFGLTTERRLTVDADGLTVEDRFRMARKGAAGGARNLTVSFLLHPDLSAAVEDGLVVVRRGEEPLVSCSVAEGWRVALEPGDYSPAFGVMQRATRIVASTSRTRDGAVRVRVLPTIGTAMERST